MLAAEPENHLLSRLSGVALGVACSLVFACGRLDIGSHGEAPLDQTGGQPSATGGTTSSGSSTGAGASPGANGGAGGQSGALGASGRASGQSGTPGAGGGASGKAGEAGSGNAGQGGTPEVVRVVELATGEYRNCVRLSNGRVRCWGWESGAGELGLARGPESSFRIGDDETPASAGDIDLGGRAIQLSVGDHSNCAVLDTGKVRCWGAHQGLGYGNTNDIGDDEPPSAAGDLEIGRPVRQVSAGPLRACALLESGAVRCWGQNQYGVLGHPDVPDLAIIGDDELPYELGDVDVGGPVAQIALGFAHACAVLTTGSLRCWGQGVHGALGYGNTNDIGDDETPASAGDVDVGGAVRQVAAGFYSTCVALVDGTVRCWGEQAPPQLGAPFPIGDDETPASVPAIEVGGRAVSVSVAPDRACALLDTGHARCWGIGQFVALGYGNVENIGYDETPASAGDLELGGPVAQVGIESKHACALLQNGDVRCWGGSVDSNPGYLATVPLGLPFLQEAIGDDEFPDEFDPIEILDP